MSVRPKTHVKKIAAAGLEWVHLDRNSRNETAYLAKTFHYNSVDLAEVLPPIQRPKVVSRGNYVFMILLFPVYDYRTKTIATSEVDFFISRERIVTVNDGSLGALTALHEEYSSQKKRELDTAHVLHEILSTLLSSIFPMSLHLSQDIDQLERGLFDSNQRGLILELLRVKTNIVNVRKAMQGHKKVIRKLMSDASGIIPLTRMEDYYNQLVDYTKEIWDTLELQRETIDALHEAHSSLLSNRTSDTIKRLTAISVTVYFLTLVAALFAMDVGGVPWRGDAYGFLKILATIAILGSVMLAIFRKKNWI
ncbi:MAG: CorA family divalent cation transporter [Patescibacteria group bacterium]